MTLSLNQKIDQWLARPTVAKMISFAIIGLGNTVIDFGVFSLGYQIFGLGLVPANVLAWLLAVTVSYVLNTLYTFHAESGRTLRRKDYITFLTSGILGVVATTVTLVVLSRYTPVYIAKLMSIFTGFVVNFMMSHLVVFRAKHPPKSPN